MRTDGKGAWEETLNFVGESRGSDVEILGIPPELEIAHAAPSEEGLMPRRAQRTNDLGGACSQSRLRDARLSPPLVCHRVNVA